MPHLFFAGSALGRAFRSLCAGALLLALSFPPAALAQHPPSPSLNDLSLEELMDVEVQTVYGASKYEQTVAEAPASVTVITADEIKMYGYRNLAEILQSVRGFSMSYDRNYHYIGFRGFSRPGDYNTRLLLLIDGIRINDNVYDDAGVGNDFPLDIDLISRVEVIRGPGHSLYGSNAFFGVINVITKSGRDLGGAELAAAGGSFSTYQGRASYGTKDGNAREGLVSVSFLDSKGRNLYYPEYDTPEQNNGWARDADGERFGSAFAKLSYRDFILEGGYLRRRKNVPTASFGTVFNTPLNRTVDARAFADLRYERSYDSRLEVLARISFNRYYYDGDYLYADTPLNQDYSRGDALSSEFHVTREFSRHKVIAGAEVRGNFRQDQRNYDSSTVYLDDRRSSVTWGVFAQDEFILTEALVLHGGLRYDHFSSFGGTVNPRVALVYAPLEDTTLKLIYGRAFRAPNSYELYYASPLDFVSNPRLEEETNTSYEAVLEQGLGENLNASVTAFYNQMENVISQVELPGGLHTFQNIDDYSIRGIGFELQGKWEGGFQGRASYTLQQARRSGADDVVTNSPRQLAKLNLIAPLVEKKVFLGVEEQYTDSRRTLAGSWAPRFFVTNLTLFTRDLFKGLELSASVYNLFDRRYSDPGSEDHLQDKIGQDGRTFRLKATYAF